MSEIHAVGFLVIISGGGYALITLLWIESVREELKRIADALEGKK